MSHSRDRRLASDSPSPLLLLAYYYPPQNASGAQRPSRLAKYLKEFGHLPRIVTAGKGVSPDPDVLWADETHHSFRNQCIRGVQRLLGRRGDRLIWILPAMEVAEPWLQQHPNAILFSTYPPACTHLAALQMKRRHHLRWVADFRDPAVGNAFRQNPISRVCDRWLEKTVIANADLVLTNTDPAREDLVSRHPHHREKVHTLWNGFDPEDVFGPAPIDPLLEGALLHVGDVYGPRHPGILLTSINRLIASCLLPPDAIRIRLIGPLASNSPFRQHPLYQSFTRNGLLECNQELVPKGDAMRLIASSPRLLLLDLTGRERNVQVPAKLFEYVRVGRPILALTTPDSPAERILAHSGVRHVCIRTTDSEDQIDAKLLEFLALPTTPVPYSDWFSTQFEARTQVAVLAGLLACLRK
jgi:hypothetical protein